MHQPPVLRVARHTDMHAIWQLDVSVFGEDVYPGFFFRQAMDLWPELLLVAELDGRLLGYALGGLGQDSSQGWLLSLAVLPEARGFGLAERMMLRVEQALAGLRVERVRLTVDPVNPAQRLYFRLGYVQLSEERDYFGPGEDRLLLEKRLG
ncbi:acetyltransferase [Aeromonas encheleia]|jgi:ribosomal protein S18 acetylase RimI-like enzyme|uniref:GNAT family N-acetyltransferase n=1 Tax=Aeromonas encheleia TaxID=73010 RepID=A0AAE9SC83_9GAMM|nr:MULTISPECIES: N-acetyltransferase [Aeromonas]MBV7415364.1 GNAT family N-acetyltransferase [Aeromonas sp. sif2433]MBV7437902.1 GNAT family N-acetyltransferase [Aeromonas sp. sif2416]MBV7598510.1 GNAT family N-acetyltransferase [Aeromonas sp. sia0103]UNP88956.1 GNAT family N-acetyltransferase [Aeromonas encheleia]USV57141.1 GNAT family N-acetyltransferase [Aeromonas encheleia]